MDRYLGSIRRSLELSAAASLGLCCAMDWNAACPVEVTQLTETKAICNAFRSDIRLLTTHDQDKI